MALPWPSWPQCGDVQNTLCNSWGRFHPGSCTACVSSLLVAAECQLLNAIHSTAVLHSCAQVHTHMLSCYTHKFSTCTTCYDTKLQYCEEHTNTVITCTAVTYVGGDTKAAWH